jgi:hypothetical protein
LQKEGWRVAAVLHVNPFSFLRGLCGY